MIRYTCISNKDENPIEGVNRNQIKQSFPDTVRVTFNGKQMIVWNTKEHTMGKTTIRLATNQILSTWIEV